VQKDAAYLPADLENPIEGSDWHGLVPTGKRSSFPTTSRFISAISPGPYVNVDRASPSGDHEEPAGLVAVSCRHAGARPVEANTTRQGQRR